MPNSGRTVILLNLGLGTGLTGVVGQSRNAVMNVAAASSTATWTADELIVETALGGTQYRLNNLNLSVNLATTGAGGMDTGTVPTTGFVALYVIYNPTTQASALLAVDATSTTPGEVYSGDNMPSGYTASALVSVWRIASGQFVIGYQEGRRVTTQLNLAGNFLHHPPHRQHCRLLHSYREMQKQRPWLRVLRAILARVQLVQFFQLMQPLLEESLTLLM
ncbi:hypothetical protein ABC733_17035 [Mangrovibacter sp. SLW1]